MKSPRDHIYVVAIAVKDTVATNVKNVRSSSRSSSTRSCSSYSVNIYLTLCSHGSSAFAELLVLKVWFWVTVAHQIWSKYYSLLLLYCKILLCLKQTRRSKNITNKNTTNIFFTFIATVSFTAVATTYISTNYFKFWDPSISVSYTHLTLPTNREV